MRRKTPFWTAVASAAIFGAGFVALLAAQAQSAATTPAATPAQTAPAQPASASARPASPWRGSQIKGMSQRADMFYESAWGVDDLRVKVAESGELIRFSYRIVDPQKAAVLNDKKFEPELDDAQARVKLSIPQMEKVGKLRQQSTPRAGMDYWMAFSNPTLAVKRGHHVDVVIGSFRASNLLVE